MFGVYAVSGLVVDWKGTLEVLMSLSSSIHINTIEAPVLRHDRGSEREEGRGRQAGGRPGGEGSGRGRQESRGQMLLMSAGFPSHLSTNLEAGRT